MLVPHQSIVTHIKAFLAFLLFFNICVGALQQGNRIPADHVGKYRERKKFLDQVLKQDIEEMRKMCEVRMVWVLFDIG